MCYTLVADDDVMPNVSWYTQAKGPKGVLQPRVVLPEDEGHLGGRRVVSLK